MPGDLAVVIPAKNEADRIGATVRAAAQLPGADLIVVVDDGSSDGTAAAASEAGARVVRHPRNRGKAAALETGAEAVRLLESALLVPALLEPGGPAQPVPHLLLFLDGLATGPAPQRPALPDPGRVRGGAAAGRRLGRRDGPDHRPAAPRAAGHRGGGPARPPGHRP
jgi:glycosyltransferase involved in cell wall biosynthesis